MFLLVKVLTKQLITSEYYYVPKFFLVLKKLHVIGIKIAQETCPYHIYYFI